MFAKPGVLLRIEGVTVFALSLLFYHDVGAPWWHFFLLFLWPDLFMLGYLVSVRLGTQLYNLVHTYVFRWRSRERHSASTNRGSYPLR